jgi:hypothetical protein
MPTENQSIAEQVAQLMASAPWHRSILLYSFFPQGTEEQMNTLRSQCDVLADRINDALNSMGQKSVRVIDNAWFGLCEGLYGNTVTCREDEKGRLVVEFGAGMDMHRIKRVVTTDQFQGPPLELRFRMCLFPSIKDRSYDRGLVRAAIRPMGDDIENFRLSILKDEEFGEWNLGYMVPPVQKIRPKAA